MKDLNHRLQALERTAKAMKAEKLAHNPFVLYRPWNLARDEHFVIFYPDGLFQKEQKFGPMPFSQVVERMASYPPDTDLEITMGECMEWLFVFHFFSEHSKIYTQEQLERFKQQELERWPEQAYLFMEEGADMQS